MGGAFQTSRDIFENPIWQNIVEFRLFFLIYGKATFIDGVKIGEIILKKGQWIRSIRNLQIDLEFKENNATKRYSTSTISRAIRNLIKDGRLVVKSMEACKGLVGGLSEACSQLGTLFEVVNYAKYQGFMNYTNSNLEQGLPEACKGHEKQRNNNKKGNKKGNKKVKKSTYMFFDNPELNDTFLSFIDYRISIKAKMTDRAIELMIAKLKKECASDGERIKTLNNSILNGWKGIFPKSDTKYPQKKSIKDNFEQREYPDEVLESLYKNK